jgi:hypothetical protein
MNQPVSDTKQPREGIILIMAGNEERKAAILATGHAIPQMHQLYILLQRSAVAKAFGICSNGVERIFPPK